jgi:hypothetical protein
MKIPGWNAEVTLNKIDENYHAYRKSEPLSGIRTFNNASLAPKVIPSRKIDWCALCLDICLTNPRLGACINRCYKLEYC